jgi:cytochrome P450
MDAATHDLGLAGAAHLRGAIHKGIVEADDEIAYGLDEPYTVIRHLRQNGASKRQVVGQMFGMVLGFIPTNVLAGGNMLETLLRNPGFLERTQMAVDAGDDELLWRCIREALRFRNINPAMWRECPKGYTFSDGRKIPPHTQRVFISAQTAMFDGARVQRAQVFDPDRPDEDYMIFGVGQHWCIGAYIAKAQLTQTFKVLVDRGLQADNDAVTARFSGIFPMSLEVSMKKEETP